MKKVPIPVPIIGEVLIICQADSHINRLADIDGSSRPADNVFNLNPVSPSVCISAKKYAAVTIMTTIKNEEFSMYFLVVKPINTNPNSSEISAPLTAV